MRDTVLYLQKNDGINCQIFRFVCSKHHQWQSEKKREGNSIRREWRERERKREREREREGSQFEGTNPELTKREEPKSDCQHDE